MPARACLHGTAREGHGGRCACCGHPLAGTIVPVMTPTETLPVTGIILAGGRSTRFGSDKASALLAGRPLLEWVVSAVSAVCNPVIVVASPGQELPRLTGNPPIRRIDDVAPDLGPLAGLVGGLDAAASEFCFATSCDAPLLRPEAVTFLRDSIGDHDIACPEVDGRLQPLVALYRRRTCLPVFEQCVARRHLRLTDAFAGLDVCVIPEERIREADPALESFINANRPAVVAEIESRLAERRGQPMP